MTKEGSFALNEFPLPERHEAAASEARTFLEGFGWCREVSELFFDRGILQCAVYYCVFSATDSAESEDVWVVAGDIPPMLFSTELCSNGGEVLAIYGLALLEHIKAFLKGEEDPDLQPLQMDNELAQMLVSRLGFIVDNIFVDYKEEIESFSVPLSSWAGEIAALANASRSADES